jgi:2-oxoisovalerate dehydrogenase E1 component
MVAIPGLTVVFPSHRHDVGLLLERATLDWEHPVVFFEHKLLYSATEDPAGFEMAAASPRDPGASLFPIMVKREQMPDLTLVTYGGSLPIVERVADALGEEDLVVEIVVPSLLQPFPKHTLLELLQNRNRVAIIEESPFGPGFGSELAATLAENRFAGHVRRLAPPPVPIPAARTLESMILPDERQMFDAMVAFVTQTDRA